MRSKKEANLALDKYADTIRKICFVHLKNYHDTEDIFQDVFLKYIQSDIEFESDAHEKAWLIRVAINACKNNLKSFFRRRVISLEELMIEPSYIGEDNREVFEAVNKLPEKYRRVIYLFYFEGYTALEIATILKKNENTIYTWMSRARAQLKKDLGGEPYGK